MTDLNQCQLLLKHHVSKQAHGVEEVGREEEWNGWCSLLQSPSHGVVVGAEGKERERKGSAET